MFDWLKKIVLIPGKAGDIAASNEAGNGWAARPRQVKKSVQYKEHGDNCLAQGKLDEAAASYRQAIVVDGQYADALLNLGFVLSEQK